MNRALAVMIREAKALGVPNDNIQRAITRGSSDNEGDYKEAVYEVGRMDGYRMRDEREAIEGLTDADPHYLHTTHTQAYGYGGAGIIINCLTDNTNRAKTEINNVIKKTEVKLATSGSVAFNFERRGLLELAGVVDEDTVLEAALEADVEDFSTKVSQVWMD